MTFPDSDSHSYSLAEFNYLHCVEHASTANIVEIKDGKAGRKDIKTFTEAADLIIKRTAIEHPDRTIHTYEIKDFMWFYSREESLFFSSPFLKNYYLGNTESAKRPEKSVWSDITGLLKDKSNLVFILAATAHLSAALDNIQNPTLEDLFGIFQLGFWQALLFARETMQAYPSKIVFLTDALGYDAAVKPHIQLLHWTADSHHFSPEHIADLSARMAQYKTGR